MFQMASRSAQRLRPAAVASHIRLPETDMFPVAGLARSPPTLAVFENVRCSAQSRPFDVSQRTTALSHITSFRAGLCGASGLDQFT